MLILILALAVPPLAVALLGYYGAYRILQGNGRVPLTVRPEDYGLAYEKVSCRTNDGLTIRGWFIPAKAASARTLLFCHGWGTNKGEILRFTHGLAERGFNLLFFDFRLCGESEGERLSVGYLESRDFDAAAALMKRLRPKDRYGVFGLSMGSMVAFCGAARHPGFSAVVLESPFPSHNAACRRYLRHNNGIPYLPLVPVILFWIRWMLGTDPNVMSPDRCLADFRVPVLAISGEDDLKSTPEMARELLDPLTGPKEFWVVAKAGHAKCAEVAGEAYTDRLARFYLTHMPLSPQHFPIRK